MANVPWAMWQEVYAWKLMRATNCSVKIARQSAKGSKEFWQVGDSPIATAENEADEWASSR